MHSNPISWNEHQRWFYKKLTDQNCKIYIACNSRGKPVGQIRFDLNGSSATIDISLDDHYRRKGLGFKLLHEGIDKLIKGTQVDKLFAEVKTTNTASRRIFQKAGFTAHTPSLVFTQGDTIQLYKAVNGK